MAGMSFFPSGVKATQVDTAARACRKHDQPDLLARGDVKSAADSLQDYPGPGHDGSQRCLGQQPQVSFRPFPIHAHSVPLGLSLQITERGGVPGPPRAADLVSNLIAKVAA